MMNTSGKPVNLDAFGSCWEISTSITEFLQQKQAESTPLGNSSLLLDEFSRTLKQGPKQENRLDLASVNLLNGEPVRVGVT